VAMLMLLLMKKLILLWPCGDVYVNVALWL
jgi:hypothetical protein